MTEVGHADLSRLLQSKRNDCSAIVTSRKRKLRELFAVATQVDTLPDDGFANPDAPAATPAEWQFLQASDILQGKTLNELNIPARPRPSLERLKRSITDSTNAAAKHASPAPSVGMAQKAAPEAQNEAATLGTSMMKNGDAGSEGRTTSTPDDFARATPNLKAPLPSPQVLSSPGRPTNANSKLASTIEPSTAGSIGDTTEKQTTASKGVSSDAVTSQPPTQVQAQPGTKGPTKATKDAHASRSSGTTLVGGLDGKTVARTEGNVPLSVKVPVDASKVPEAMSTPGSTAASATTPAVHDASTDTSPDNDGPRNGVVSERKEPLPNNELKSQRGAVDLQEQSLSAEDQLLQESIQSKVAASKPVGEIPVIGSGASADASRSKGTAQPVAPRVTSKPVSSLDEASQAASISAARPSLAEVPDSQGGTPDEMDLDTAEVNPESQDQKVPVIEESNLLIQDALNTNLPEKAKEQPPAAERAVTRVSSGAMRLKSVSEIVGTMARPAHSTDRDSTSKGAHDQLTPVTSTPQSPVSRVRNSGTTRRDRFRGQPSTVLFGKQPKRVEDKTLVPGHKETIQPSDDYYTPLFVQNFTGSSNWMQPLERILFQANKTISTPDAHLVIQDHQACRVLRRVYHLQQHDKWSLRQPKRCPEPTRPPSQWDVLLQEMKWMRTDFREERKWKMAVARNLAYACVEWHDASPEERKDLQVAAVIPPKPQLAEGDVSMVDAEEDCAGSQSTPDLVSSGDVESPQNVDDFVEDFVETVAPSAIFTLQEEDVVFGLRRTAASDKLLMELPMYGSPLRIPRFDINGSEYDPDAHWRRPALPLSRYVEGELRLALPGHPRKRSRFEYENEDSDDEKEGDFVADHLVHHVRLPPSTDEVSLFNPESKHIRDRLHAGHQFRPPSEHPMPTQGFYESRSPSQWTMLEDDELRGLVREYSYNWSLISNMLSTKSSFMAGAERRTPWECFERWINLEGLPADMQKTQYFKAYNSRIEAAQRVIVQQNQLAVQQATASGGTITPVRRRPSVPLRVERRRNQKHLTLFDAMRKLAKKRETALQKQQHSASQNAASKKTSDTVSQRPAKTPRDYSLMRWERDQALAEKMAQYAQRQEAQRRAAMQARAQGQAVQVAGAPGVGVPGQNANHLAGNSAVNGVGRPMSNQLAAAAAAVAASQGRQRMPMQAPANGVGVAGVQAQMTGGGGLSAPPQMNGAPTAQMQGMQAQQRMPMPNQQPDANLMLRAQRISEQQRAAVQIQQSQQGQQHHPQQQNNVGTPGSTGQHNSPPLRNGVNGISQQTFMNSAQAMMASYSTAAANGNGHASPQANSLHMPSAASAASPGQRVHTQLPPGITAQLNQLEATFRAKHANLTPEQARQLATEHLTRAMMAQRQNAMNAAAGATSQAAIANSIAATTSPHQYAALLRQQQQQQAQQQQQLLQQQQQQQQQQQKGTPQQHLQQPQAQQPKHPQPQHPQQPQHQQHNTPGQATPVLPAVTPTAASASPAQSHQRASSGSATPSAAGK